MRDWLRQHQYLPRLEELLQILILGLETFWDFHSLGLFSMDLLNLVPIRFLPKVIINLLVEQKDTPLIQ